MILAYHRPKTLEEALILLARSEPPTLPLAGGTALNARPPVLALPFEDFEVVDLQDLGLDTLHRRGEVVSLGATLTLQRLLEEVEDLPTDLRRALQHEATYTQRQMATVAGSLVAADGRSPWAAAMMALDATLVLFPHEERLRLGDLYALRWPQLRGRLITAVEVNLRPRLALETVSRTPADRPLLVVAVARWPSGRTRVVVGGWGDAPRLAMDGPEADGAEVAVRNVTYEATDRLADADYRREVGAVLVRRALARLSEEAP